MSELSIPLIPHLMAAHSDLLWSIALGLFCVAAIVAIQSRATRRLPPGPPGHFFSGNAHQLPEGPAGREYFEWSKIYGDVLHLRNYSQHIVVLNSIETIRALFTGRPELYNDRPQTPMYSDLVGRSRTIFNSPFGPRYKRYARLLHGALSRTAVSEYRPTLEDATARMVRGMANSPERFLEHFRTCAGRISMKVAYGHDMPDGDDYYINLVRDSIALANEAFMPGRWLVDSFPILKHVPSWMPGAGFKTWAANSRRKLNEMTRAPLQIVKEQMASGTAIPSYTSRNLANTPADPVAARKHEDAVVWTAAAMYVGTADTSVAALSTFALLMVRNPAVQRKAQAEIDAFLGGARLPCTDDKPHLPYVEALMKECMRYNTVGPLALAHSLRRTDEFNGYTIPKGATVYANLWAVTRDPRIYSSPHVFRPERFMRESEKSVAERDPWEIAFGIGPRRCPGMHLADTMLFLSMARMLAAFEFLPSLDENGQEVMPPEEWQSGPNCGAKPFQCRIVPRSADLAAMLSDA